MFAGVDPGGPPGARRQLDGPEAWRSEDIRFRESLSLPDRAVLVISAWDIPVGRVWARIDHDTVTISFAVDEHAKALQLRSVVTRGLGPESWLIQDGKLTYVPQAFTHQPIPNDSSDHHGSLQLSTGSIASMSQPR
jgi:hypothetical protein